MLNDIAKIWVAALRSGEFKQATQMLRSDGGHCCLGVLCELHRRQTGRGRWQDNEGDFKYVTIDDGGNYLDEDASELPVEVRDWAGLVGYSGEFWDKSEGKSRNLARINDGGASFKEIADLIESEPERLFHIDPY